MARRASSLLLRFIGCCSLLQGACGRVGFEDPEAGRFSASLSSAETNPTNHSPLTIQAAFATDVVDFSLSAVTVSSGSLVDLQALSPRIFEFHLIPSASELISLSIREGAVHNAAGDRNRASLPFDIYYDAEAPVVASVTINNGAQYAPAPLMVVRVAVTDLSEEMGLWVRIAEAEVSGDCQSQYADNGWASYAGASQDYSCIFSSHDGEKKACVWAKDVLGNTSVIEPSVCTEGVDCDTINLAISNIPVVVGFDVVNDNSSSLDYQTTTFAIGDPVRVVWSVTDAEGLDNNPISLEYTTDNGIWHGILSSYGGLTGNPTSYADVYTGFTAPVATYFRLRLVARDSANNTSVRALSDTLNTGAWSVYAGSTDRGIGGMARSAEIETEIASQRRFAIHPFTNDIYLVDDGSGILKIDAASGLVSVFAGWGHPGNLPGDGPLPANPTVYVYWSSLEFDHLGRLYVVTYPDYNGCATDTGIVYQIDLNNRWVRRYIGGGIDYAGTDPFSMLVIPGRIVFDEDNSLYFISSCTPNRQYYEDPVFRLMKVTQKPDGTAGTFSVVVGNCTRGNPTPGGLAAESPFTSNVWNGFLPDFAVWDHGNVLYYAPVHSLPMLKVLNGRIYATDLDSASAIAYDPVSNRLLLGDDAVSAVVPNLTGDGGETLDRVIASASGTGNCTADGINSADACVNAGSGGVAIAGQGVAIFADGPSVNRLRYVDPAGKVQTLFGTLPFYGNGLNKRFMRGSPSGIYFKTPSELEPTAYPTGLYFADPRGFVFGRIDPSTGVTSIWWGNQQGAPGGLVHPTGTRIGPEVTLGGGANDGGDVMALGFGADGLPYLRYNNVLAKIDANREVVALQLGSTYDPWWDFSGNLLNSSLYMYGTMHNMSIKDGGIFLAGGSRSVPYPTRSPIVRFFDFPNNLIVEIIGQKESSGFTPDTSIPGTVVGSTLDESCLNSDVSGYHVYHAAEDRLYFSEADKIRYVSDPTHPAQSTLSTLLASPEADPIRNFTFSPSRDRVIYYTDSTHLYCYPIISTGDAWCDNLTLLGPPTVMNGPYRGPDQFAWLDERTLLISNYRGEILKLELDLLR